MTDKAKRRRKQLAAELGCSSRTAANIIAARTEECRAAGLPPVTTEAQSRDAKALVHLAEDELGARPAHTFCLGLVVADGARREGESRELRAARLFLAHREELAGSAERKAARR